MPNSRNGPNEWWLATHSRIINGIIKRRGGYKVDRGLDVLGDGGGALVVTGLVLARSPSPGRRVRRPAATATPPPPLRFLILQAARGAVPGSWPGRQQRRSPDGGRPMSNPQVVSKIRVEKAHITHVNTMEPISFWCSKLDCVF
jgi:hypothetical protein